MRCDRLAMVCCTYTSEEVMIKFIDGETKCLLKYVFRFANEKGMDFKVYLAGITTIAFT